MRMPPGAFGSFKVSPNHALLVNASKRGEALIPGSSQEWRNDQDATSQVQPESWTPEF